MNSGMNFTFCHLPSDLPPLGNKQSEGVPTLLSTRLILKTSTLKIENS